MQILSMENNIDNLHLLTFHNLSSLSFEISENCCWNVLVSILQNTPKLKHLAIEVCMNIFNYICTIYKKMIKYINKFKIYHKMCKD